MISKQINQHIMIAIKDNQQWIQLSRLSEDKLK